MKQKRWRAVALAGAAVLALTGCFRNPTAPDLEDAIPAALLEAELGITKAWADERISGFNVSVTVGIVVPDGEVTADDLRTILGIIVEHANISNLAYIQLDARDASLAPNDYSTPIPYIDLRAPARELGIELDEDDRFPDDIEVDWDVAVEVSTSS